MTPRIRTVPIIVAAFLVLAAAAWAVEPSSVLSAQEERGRTIYFTGTSPSGDPITAYFGRDLIEIPGEGAVCSTCHGYDGLGRPESGVIPTNITWEYTMKSYGHIHPDGLEHGPFTEESLKSYMRDGIYPGGKKGDPAMPIYLISDRDLGDLVAFMKRLGSLTDPGVSKTAIRIGIVVPSAGNAGELGRAMEGIIRASFSEANSRGGIYGRTMELVPIALPGGESDPISFVGQSLKEKDIFALVSPFVPGFDAELAALAERERTPMIGPFTLFPSPSVALNRHVFYALSGLREQVRALLEVAEDHEKLRDPNVLLLFPSRPDLAEVIVDGEGIMQVKGWGHVGKFAYTSGLLPGDELIAAVKSDRVDAIVFYGGEEDARALLKSLEKSERMPLVLAPGILFGRTAAEIPPAFKGKVYLAFPTLPEDRKQPALRELAALSRKYGLAETHQAARLSAYAAAKIVIEGLKRAGRDINRERLLNALETMYEFDTGVTPPITFGRNRHIGAFGAHVVTVDLDKEGRIIFPFRKWITP